MYLRKLSVMTALTLLSFGLTPQNTWGFLGLGNTEGDFDESAACTYAFSNTLSTPATGDNTPADGFYVSEGDGSCTWTVIPKGKNKPPQSETANGCDTSFSWPVTGVCVDHTDPDGFQWSEATYTGACQSGANPVIIGSVDCSASQPAFCEGTDCVWNHGFGSKQGQKVSGMTTEQCDQFGTAFTYKETFEGHGCDRNNITEIDEAAWTTGHSHSWDSNDQPFVEEKKGEVINNAATFEQGELMPDMEIEPNTFDLTATPPGGSATYTVRIQSIPQDPDPRDQDGTPVVLTTVDVAQIDVTTLRVNGFDNVDPGSCGFDSSDNPSRLSCSAAWYVDGDFTGIIEGNEAVFTATGETLQGTPFTTDAERRAVIQ
jgi:hypothetical protein